MLRGLRGNRPKPGPPGRGKREPHVLAQYLPTLLFLIVATGIGVALIIVGYVLGPRRPDLQKLSPYECGFEAFEDARMKFDVRYYLIAIQFIVFDPNHLHRAVDPRVGSWDRVRWSPWACSSGCCSSASSTSGRRERSNGSDPNPRSPDDQPDPGRAGRRHPAPRRRQPAAGEGLCHHQRRRAGELGAHRLDVADDLRPWPAARWR